MKEVEYNELFKLLEDIVTEYKDYSFSKRQKNNELALLIYSNMTNIKDLSDINKTIDNIKYMMGNSISDECILDIAKFLNSNYKLLYNIKNQ